MPWILEGAPASMPLMHGRAQMRFRAEEITAILRGEYLFVALELLPIPPARALVAIILVDAVPHDLISLQFTRAGRSTEVGILDTEDYHLGQIAMRTTRCSLTESTLTPNDLADQFLITFS